jgi:hypothetical protein
MRIRKKDSRKTERRDLMAKVEFLSYFVTKDFPI